MASGHFFLAVKTDKDRFGNHVSLIISAKSYSFLKRRPWKYNLEIHEFQPFGRDAIYHIMEGDIKDERAC